MGQNNGVLHEDLFHQDEYKLRNYKFPFRTQSRVSQSVVRIGVKKSVFAKLRAARPVRRQGGREQLVGLWIRLVHLDVEDQLREFAKSALLKNQPKACKIPLSLVLYGIGVPIKNPFRAWKPPILLP